MKENNHVISRGYDHMAGVQEDGTVVIVGLNARNGESEKEHLAAVAKWKNIISVAAGYHNTVGLMANGKVVAAGKNEDGQCNVGEWKNIVAIATSPKVGHTLGLKSDGSVVATGYASSCYVLAWRNIISISAAMFFSVGLQSDGSVVASEASVNDKVSKWDKIIEISSGVWHVLGLKSNGTVVAVGDNDYGECETSSWKDIINISAGNYHSVGLKSDGTVVAVGDNDYGECETSSWKDIVAISAGHYCTLGLKSNGTVVAAGNTYTGFRECGSILNWRLRVPQNRVYKLQASGEALFNATSSNSSASLKSAISDIKIKQSVPCKNEPLLTKLLKSHPSALQNRNLLQSLLKDFFPDRKMEVNLLMFCYDMDIHLELQTSKTITRQIVERFKRNLCKDYGVQEDKAEWAVSVWVGSYGQAILGKKLKE